MTKSKTVERTKANQNVVTMEIKRREKKLGKKITHPADPDDRFSINSIELGKEKGLEIIYGNDNKSTNELLRNQGYIEKPDGMMILKAESNEKAEKLISFDEEKKKREEVELDREA